MRKSGGQKQVWELGRRPADDHDILLIGMHYWDGSRVMEKDGITHHGLGAPKEL